VKRTEKEERREKREEEKPPTLHVSRNIDWNDWAN
jgi:hypothetical protein